MPLKNPHLDRQASDLYGTVQRRIRRIMKQCRQAGFRTAKGIPIRILGRTRKGLIIMSSRPAFNTAAQEPKRIIVSWSEIRKAIEMVVRDGLVDRRRLEGAKEYSSAIMGLLLSFLWDSVRRARTGRGKYMVRLIRVRIYISGCERDPQVLEKMDALGGALVQVTYYHLKRRRTTDGQIPARGWWKAGGLPPEFGRLVEEKGWLVQIDPGAFSVKGSGDPIPLDGYLSFLDASGLENYVALDVIGDLEATKANLLEMLRRGYKPIPVYHYGEPPEYLAWLVRHGFDIIGLGGAAKRTEQERIAFFDWIFRAYPEQPFHGFGIGTLLAAAYNFFSVDTTVWRVGRAAGRCLTDWGQERASEPGLPAVVHNLKYLLGLGSRAGSAGLQSTWNEFLDGRIAWG